MKKRIIILSAAAILVASSVIYVSCSDAKASKPMKPDLVETNLADYGFINVPSEKIKINNKAENELFLKTGLNFLSDDSITSFCKLNGLIISGAENFKAEIPNENKSEIVSNYNKLKYVKHYYYDNFFDAYFQVGTYKHDSNNDPLNRKGIMVVAPPELFNENAFIKKDPIVLVKVDAGWLELTRW